MDRPSRLKQITLPLFMQTLGLLLILFGLITIASVFNKLSDASFRDIREYFILALIAGAAIVAGYKLVRLQDTGRQWSALVILAITLFMIPTMRASLTDQRSKFAWDIWTFHGEISSANAASYFDRFDKIPFVILLFGFSLIGFLISNVAIQVIKKRIVHPRFLIGHSCTSVIQYENNWFIGLGEECGVTIESPWRIIADGRIAVTNTDHGQKFGLPQPVYVPSEAMKVLNGHKIVDVRIDAETSDLHIFFDHNKRIDILNVSSGYECWQLGSADGELWIGRNE